MLNEKALLVHLTISRWTGRKIDKTATGAVERRFKAAKRSGNYTKKLLPNSTELAEVEALTMRIREYVYANTLPWLSDGTRILSAKNYLEFVSEFGKRRQEFNRVVSAFLNKYPKLRDQAAVKLGKLYNELEYPTVKSLRDSFQCEITFMPMPDVGDFRTEVLESEKDAFLAKMHEVENTAVKECFERLRDVVATAANKLSDPNAIFRNTLIENISSICELLPKLNISDDAKLEATRREVEAIVQKLAPDLLRDNADERADAAKKLNDISSKMGAFMGAL